MKKQPPRWPLFAWLGLAALLGGLIGFISTSVVYERGELFGESAPHARLAPAVHISLAPTVGMSPEQKCRGTDTGCARMLLAAMNQQRALVSSDPLVIDWTLSHHRADCISAQDHANHLAQVVTSWTDFGQYAHDQFRQACAIQSGMGGQNVGAAQGNKSDAITTDFRQMMTEGHIPLGACLEGHDCNITYAGYRRVGIGFAYDRALSAYLIVEDFTR